MSTPNSFNQAVIDEFRANGGHVGGQFEQMPLLLLHHVGAKTGTPRVTPLAYARDGNRYVIFASKGGAPTNPDWYHNLKAHPDVSVEIGTETIAVAASEAEGEERRRLVDHLDTAVPALAAYQAKIDRVIPLIILTPR